MVLWCCVCVDVQLRQMRVLDPRYSHRECQNPLSHITLQGGPDTIAKTLAYEEVFLYEIALRSLVVWVRGAEDNDKETILTMVSWTAFTALSMVFGMWGAGFTQPYCIVPSAVASYALVFLKCAYDSIKESGVPLGGRLVWCFSIPYVTLQKNHMVEHGRCGVCMESFACKHFPSWAQIPGFIPNTYMVHAYAEGTLAHITGSLTTGEHLNVELPCRGAAGSRGTLDGVLRVGPHT